MDIINHITGACGEAHININIVLGLIFATYYLIKKFKKTNYDNN